ncbi:MAG TPA: ABC transporter ATP-binding protein [Pirellulaceae bacterium]|nr:ABC transporter ATP-binding protein [Pirellulaceae bacterium]
MVATNIPVPAVRCQRVTKEFASGDTKTQALRGIDMEILPGEVTLLAGPSGCGKTTLISVIAGLLKPTQGVVEVMGRKLNELPGGSLVRFRAQHVGFVFQQYNLLPALTAAENTAVPLLIAGRPRRAAIAEARQQLVKLGLEGRTEFRPNQLSGGQQQRVAIARALIHHPSILVCDEPTAALDAHSGQQVMQLLTRVAAEADRAVIIVTHDHRVFQFGQRIIHLADGQIERDERTPGPPPSGPGMA